MNVAFRISEHQPGPIQASPNPLARAAHILEGGTVAAIILRASASLGIDPQAAARAEPVRLHPRSDGGCVIDVACQGAGLRLFIEVASGDVRELAAKARRRHMKQQDRLGRTVAFHHFVDEATGCLVRVHGEDELIDGLPALLQDQTDGAKACHLLAHRLNRRAVIGMTRADGTRAIVKAYKKGSQKAQAAAACHAMLAQTAFGRTSPVAVPKVMAQCQDWPGYQMEHVAGTAVAELSGTARAHGMRLAGEAMGRLHRLPLRLQLHHTQADELALLQDWVSLTAHLYPGRAAELHQAMAHVSSMLTATEAEAGDCIVHRDFHEGQVLVDGNRATLIDFDTACNGDPAQDIGNFLAHLDFDSARTGVNAAADADEFLAAYAAANTAIAPVRIDAHRAATLLRLSCIHAVPAASRHAAETLTLKALSL